MLSRNRGVCSPRLPRHFTQTVIVTPRLTATEIEHSETRMAAGLPSFEKPQAAFPCSFSSFKAVIVLSLYYLLVIFIGAKTKFRNTSNLQRSWFGLTALGYSPSSWGGRGGRSWRQLVTLHMSEDCSAP